jgi:hypothetical protein
MLDRCRDQVKKIDAVVMKSSIKLAVRLIEAQTSVGKGEPVLHAPVDCQSFSVTGKKEL